MTFIADSTFNYLLLAWLAVGLIAFVYLFFETAPYGKHVTKGWGPEISAKAGWIIEECPAFFLDVALFHRCWRLHQSSACYFYCFVLRTLFQSKFYLADASSIH